MMYALVFTIGFMGGMMYVVIDAVGVAVLMEMSALISENENLKTEIENLKDKYGE